MSLPEYMTADEVAARLRCRPEKVYRMAASGQLPSVVVGNRRLFDPAAVREAIERAAEPHLQPGVAAKALSEAVARARGGRDLEGG